MTTYTDLSHHGLAGDPPVEPAVDINGSTLRVLLRRRDAEGGLGWTLSLSGPVKSGWEQVAMHQAIAAMVSVALEDAGYPLPASLADPEVAERRLRRECARLRGELDVVTTERDRLFDGRDQALSSGV